MKSAYAQKNETSQSVTTHDTSCVDDRRTPPVAQRVLQRNGDSKESQDEGMERSELNVTTAIPTMSAPSALASAKTFARAIGKPPSTPAPIPLEPSTTPAASIASTATSASATTSVTDAAPTLAAPIPTVSASTAIPKATEAENNDMDEIRNAIKKTEFPNTLRMMYKSDKGRKIALRIYQIVKIDESMAQIIKDHSEQSFESLCAYIQAKSIEDCIRALQPSSARKKASLTTPISKKKVQDAFKGGLYLLNEYITEPSNINLDHILTFLQNDKMVFFDEKKTSKNISDFVWLQVKKAGDHLAEIFSILILGVARKISYMLRDPWAENRIARLLTNEMDSEMKKKDTDQPNFSKKVNAFARSNPILMYLNKELNEFDACRLISIRANRALMSYDEMFVYLCKDAKRVLEAMKDSNAILDYDFKKSSDPRSIGTFRLYVNKNNWVSKVLDEKKIESLEELKKIKDPKRDSPNPTTTTPQNQDEKSGNLSTTTTTTTTTTPQNQGEDSKNKWVSPNPTVVKATPIPQTQDENLANALTTTTTTTPQYHGEDFGTTSASTAAAVSVTPMPQNQGEYSGKTSETKKDCYPDILNKLQEAEITVRLHSRDLKYQENDFYHTKPWFDYIELGGKKIPFHLSSERDGKPNYGLWRTFKDHLYRGMPWKRGKDGIPVRNKDSQSFAEGAIQQSFGALNFCPEESCHGLIGGYDYGNVSLVLKKDNIKGNCKYTIGDKGEPFSTIEDIAKALAKYKKGSTVDGIGWSLASNAYHKLQSAFSEDYVGGVDEWIEVQIFKDIKFSEDVEKIYCVGVNDSEYKQLLNMVGGDSSKVQRY